MAKRATAAELRKRAAGLFVNDEALIEALEGLQPEVFRRVMKSTTNKAAQPVVKETKQRIKAGGHMESKLLYRSIGKKTKVYKRAGLSITLVGAQEGFKKQVAVPAFPGRIGGNRANRTRTMWRNPMFYFHLLDRPSKGIRGRKIVPGGTRNKPRTVRAGRRWIGTNIKAAALESQQKRVMQLLSREAGVGIVREWDKLAQKTRQAAK